MTTDPTPAAPGPEPACPEAYADIRIGAKVEQRGLYGIGEVTGSGIVSKNPTYDADGEVWTYRMVGDSCDWVCSGAVVLEKAPSEPECPEEWRWMKPGALALYASSFWYIKGTPFYDGRLWRCLADGSPKTTDGRAFRCDDLERYVSEDDIEDALSEAKALSAALQQAQQERDQAREEAERRLNNHQAMVKKYLAEREKTNKVRDVLREISSVIGLLKAADDDELNGAGMALREGIRQMERALSDDE